MMRSIDLASVLAALTALANATPTPAEPQQQPHRRAPLPPIMIKGNAFWKDNKRFYVRGIDYQPGGSSGMMDPLGDETICKRDIAKFSKLGVNTIRVYMTDNSLNHDVCMNALADAGIYAIIDVNSPLYSINRVNPRPSYNSMYLQSVFSTIDAFIKYDNTLAFFSGNEVVNNDNKTTLAAPYVKATTRDMRQYMASRGHRKVPVGYSAADVSENRMQLAHYMNCGSEEERSDFFAFNDYSWCNTDFHQAGWDAKVQAFTGYGIPIFLSEYGCITNGRDFGEVKALMSDQMTGVYSGGLMFEYAMEVNNFGIVDITSGDVKELPEFAKFQSALAANPAPTGDGGYTSTSNSVECPMKGQNWLVDPAPLPQLPKGAKAYMAHGAGTGPGLKGAGSQNAEDGDGDSDSPDTRGPGPNTGNPDSPGSPATTRTTPATTATSSSSTENAAGLAMMGPVDKAQYILTSLVSVVTLMGSLVL